MIPLSVVPPEEGAGWDARLRGESLLILATAGSGDAEGGKAGGKAIGGEAAGGWLDRVALPPAHLPGSARWGGTRFLAEGAPAHGAACLCCVGRPVLTMELLRFYQERARGGRAFFRRVALVVPEARCAAVRAALRADTTISALFSVEEEAGQRG